MSNQRKHTKSFKDTDMQLMIGWILRIGVYVSMSVVIIGGLFYIYRHGQSIENYRSFKGIPDFVQGIGSIFINAIHLRGQAIIQLGIILLIATPVMRVVFAAIGFAIEKDYLYTFISVIVLLIIIASALCGYAG